MKSWQLQEAKAKFSQLVKEALTHGPQVVTLHEEPTVVVLSLEDYNSLNKSKHSLVQFLQKSPLKGVKLNLNRDKSGVRDVSL